MSTPEQISLINADHSILADLLGTQNTFNDKIGRETLLITRAKDNRIVVEFLEEGNKHTVFTVTPEKTETKTVHHSFLAESNDTTDDVIDSKTTKEEVPGTDHKLGDILRKFGLM